MLYIVRPTYYFKRPGPVNTNETIKLAIERGLELGVRYLVVASLTGKSALKVAEEVKGRGLGLKIVCVSFRAGGGFSVSQRKLDPSNFLTRHWRDIPELREMLEEWIKKGYKVIPFLSEDKVMQKKLRELGVEIVVSTDLGASIDQSMKVYLGLPTPLEVFNETLYLFCPGLKTSVLTAIMAADAGAIPIDEEVISMAGTEQGLDTAIVIKPAYSDEIFDPKSGLEVREIICKPRSMLSPSGYFLGRAWGYK